MADMTMEQFAVWCQRKGDAIERDDFASAMQQCGEIAIEDMRGNILAGSTPDGVAWAPPKPVTSKRGGSHQPLIVSGTLLNSFRAEVTPRGVTITNDCPYAAFQNNGTKNIEARRFMGLGDHALGRIQVVVGAYISGLLRE